MCDKSSLLLLLFLHLRSHSIFAYSFKTLHNLHSTQLNRDVKRIPTYPRHQSQNSRIRPLLFSSLSDAYNKGEDKYRKEADELMKKAKMLRQEISAEEKILEEMKSKLKLSITPENMDIEEPESETMEDKDISTNITNIGGDMGKFEDDVMVFPRWVPYSMIGLIFNYKMKQKGPEIQKEDLAIFRTEILQKSDEFFCVSSDSMPYAAIFRGNVNKRYQRMNNSTTPANQDYHQSVWNSINKRMDEYDNGSLREKIQLFWLYDPEPQTTPDEQDLDRQPVIFVVGAELKPYYHNKPEKAKLTDHISRESFLILLTSMCALFTSFAYSQTKHSLNPGLFSKFVNEQNLSPLKLTIPVSFGIFGFHMMFYAIQRFMGKRSNISVGPPIILPSFRLGTFGALASTRSFPSERTNLFDFAFLPSLTKLLVSLVFCIYGIYVTVRSPLETLSNFPHILVAQVKSSMLVSFLSYLIAPKILMLPLSQPIPIHPLFLIGWSGLISSCLELLPFGKLNGGRATTALFGRKFGTFISLITFGFLSVTSLSPGFPHVSFFWLLIALFFQRQQDTQIRNEITPVVGVRGFFSNVRDSKGKWRLPVYLSTALLISSILLPSPGFLPL